MREILRVNFMGNEAEEDQSSRTGGGGGGGK